MIFSTSVSAREEEAGINYWGPGPLKSPEHKYVA
jgi:hypothetical protein